MRHFLIILFAFVTITKVFAQAADDTTTTLSSKQMVSFREQAIKSIFDLEKYIQIIASKRSSMEKKSSAIDLALDLFQSDTVTVEISSLNSRQNHIYAIKYYLKMLKMLPYSSVKINWYKVYLAPSFTLGPDGNYYGSATYLQKFEGKGNRETGNYKDITKRHIIIVLKKVDAYNGVDKISEYILKLGDISVLETTNG